MFPGRARLMQQVEAPRKLSPVLQVPLRPPGEERTLSLQPQDMAPVSAPLLTSLWPSPLCRTKAVRRRLQRPFLLQGSVSLVLTGTLVLSQRPLTKGRYRGGHTQQGQQAVPGVRNPQVKAR